MGLIARSPTLTLLDLPAEIRVRIYRYALPEQIVVKAWDDKYFQQSNHHETEDSSDSKPQGLCEIQFPKSSTSSQTPRPRFMLASKLIHQETTALLWTRTTLDLTRLDTQAWHFTSSTPTTLEEACSQGASTIVVPEYVLPLILRVKLPAIGKTDVFSQHDWSAVNLPNLRDITLFVPGETVAERHIRRLYVGLRRGLVNEETGVKTDYSLSLLFGEWMNAWLNAESSVNRIGAPQSQNLAGSAWTLASELGYNVRFELPQHKIEQSWMRMPAYGVVEEIRHSATLRVSYDWNADVLACDFEDVSETAVAFEVAMDHDVHHHGTPLPGAKGEHDYPKTYRSAAQWVEFKMRGLLDVLVHKEMERRGMVPEIQTCLR